MKAELRGHTPPPPPSNPNGLFTAVGSTLKSGCTAITTLDASCIEKLLLHCGAALENNDTTLAQQVMWVLNNIAAPNGEPNQRLTAFFLKALTGRSARLCPNSPFPSPRQIGPTLGRPMSVTELAGYIDLTPWHRFGFTASNGAIFRAIQGRAKIHIVDFGITHCMQWPTLMDRLAKRPEGPPCLLRITVLPPLRPPVPPLLDATTEQIGLRLDNFAKLRNLPFELHIVNNPTNPNPNFLQVLGSVNDLLSPASLDVHDDETLVVNCQSWIRYLPSPTKDEFFKAVRKLNPRIVTIGDEDAELDSSSLTARTMACFNYLWMPFDVLDTILAKDSWQRAEMEAEVGERMANVIGFEGEGRIERGESGARIGERMRKAGFRRLGFGEEAVAEVKGMMEGHASGWGLKKMDQEEVEEGLVLTWKGHSSVFTSVWAPIEF